ncbi:MAG: hypothetical protein NC131_00970 [Roseburia sp.]|nr:hypothetical protein [Roseburia sp.]
MERLTDKDLTVTLNMPQYGDTTRFMIYAQRLWELENELESGELITRDEHLKHCKAMYEQGKFDAKAERNLK